jgi:PAS domain S-box-containing protein
MIWAITVGAAVFLAAVFGLVQQIVSQERANTFASIEDINSKIALSDEVRIRSLLASLDKVLLVVRKDYAEKPGLTQQELQLRLDELKVDHELSPRVSMVDVSGDIVLSSARNVNDSQPKINVADREFFQGHKTDQNDQLHVGAPILSRASGKWVVPLTRRITKQDGSFGGILNMTVDPNLFTDPFAKTSMGPDATRAIMGRNGYTLLRLNGGKLVYGGDTRKSQLFTELKKAPVGCYTAVASSDGIRRSVCYRAIDPYDIIILAGSSVASIEEIAATKMRGYIWAAILVAVLIVMLSCLLIFGVLRQRKLLASQQSFNQLIEMVPQSIFRMNAKGNILWANRRTIEYAGPSAEELAQGFDWVVAAIHPEDKDRIKDFVSTALQEGHFNGSCEYRKRRFDGAYLWYSSEITRVQSEHGDEDYFLFTATDIHDRKKAETLLQASNAQLQLLETCVARLNDIVLITEAEPIDQLGPRIVFVNDAFVRRTGYSREDVMGQTPRILQGAKTQRSELDRIRAALSRWEPVRAELINYTKAGQEFWLELDIVPVANAQGRYTHWVAVERDVTERKLIEDRLGRHQQELVNLVEQRTKELNLAKESAELANLAKSTFLANMSHELRTPLSGVMGMINLALGRANDPKQLDWLNKGKRSAVHLMSVINDILDISKIEADRMTLEQRNFSLSEILEDAILMLDDLAHGKGLDLKLELDPSGPKLLCGDAMRLKQIVLNFLSNAVKFSQHGTVKLRAQLIEQNETGVMVRIEVIDRGVGISAEEQARLFQSFTQADESTNRIFGGSGLGLYISRRIARLMGGETGVISCEGEGSTFWATVRLRHAAEEDRTDSQQLELAPRELLMQRFSGSRVLLVEDDEVNQEIGVLLLEAVGMVVEVASNGQEAVAKAESGAYAAILMDVQMPVMNGLDATRAIRLIRGLQDTPIVAMSANAFNEDRERSLGAGMNDHIGKPVLPDLLYSTLLRWLA